MSIQSINSRHEIPNPNEYIVRATYNVHMPYESKHSRPITACITQYAVEEGTKVFQIETGIEHVRKLGGRFERAALVMVTHMDVVTGAELQKNVFFYCGELQDSKNTASSRLTIILSTEPGSARFSKVSRIENGLAYPERKINDFDTMGDDKALKAMPEVARLFICGMREVQDLQGLIPEIRKDIELQEQAAIDLNPRIAAISDRAKELAAPEVAQSAAEDTHAGRIRSGKGASMRPRGMVI